MSYRNASGQFNGEKRPLAERFWEKVNKTDDCWLWTGYLNKGYGYISIDNKAKPAYRVSYQLTYGDIPEGLVVRHMCRSKNCVNPKHLKLGTQKDNMEDAIKDGTTLKGEKNHRSILKEEQVKDFIKNKPINNINDYILLKSKELNVSPTALYDIHYRRTWKHIL
jgi:hypothetical protein